MVNQLIVSKDRREFADFERELQRDPRLKSEHTRPGYRRDLIAFEEWRAGRPMTKLLVEEFAVEL